MLVIQNGVTKLVNVKNQDGITKILDMVPDFLSKFTDNFGGKKNDESKEDDTIIDDILDAEDL